MASVGWKRFKQQWPGWLLLGVVAGLLLAAGITHDSGPRTPEERVEEISKRVACPICDGESVFESRNNASASIRTEIKAQVAAGERSNDDIIAFIEQRYGAQVLLVPRASGIDALVWALPVVVFVCAVAGLVVAFRRWRRAADTVPTDADRALVDAALGSDERQADAPSADAPPSMSSGAMSSGADAGGAEEPQ
jgi:cytochrome c-type biogenesis protein CcmH